MLKSVKSQLLLLILLIGNIIRVTNCWLEIKCKMVLLKWKLYSCFCSRGGREIEAACLGSEKAPWEERGLASGHTQTLGTGQTSQTPSMGSKALLLCTLGTNPRQHDLHTCCFQQGKPRNEMFGIRVELIQSIWHTIQIGLQVNSK